MKAGHCAACTCAIWKSIQHAGKEVLLWPRRDSMYVQFWTPTGHTAGVGYCRSCCPPFGAPGPRLPQKFRNPDGTITVEMVQFGPVVGHETAYERHKDDHYSESYGERLRLWLRDGNGKRGAIVNAEKQNAIMAEWQQERTP
jgi:hypothetical protein